VHNKEDKKLTTLRLGSRGPETELLQLGLTRAGYLSSEPDGVFGPATQRAVMAFQRDMGLTADGVAGRRTWDALMPWLTGYRTVTVKSNDSIYRLALRYRSSIKGH